MFAGAAIALFLSFSGGNWLDVPFVKQPKNDCGPASIWMLMQYWKSASSTSVEEIHRSIFSTEANGVHAQDMGRYLSANGFRVWTFPGKWDDLTENLRNGRPMIVALRGSPLHYVVVAGIEAENDIIFVNDPASRKLRAIHRGDFEKRWQATGNWTLLATPTVQAIAAVDDRRLYTASQQKAGDDRAAVEWPPADTQKSKQELEAASSAFRQEDYREAKRRAQLAEKADPQNDTTSELLATLYMLDGNVEAALKYWNRTGQPIIRNINVGPALDVDPVVLDRAFAFSRGSVMKLNDYLLTRRRLEATRLVSSYTFDFTPVDDNRFDVTLRAADASGAHYLSWLQGLAYQTIRPQVRNITGRTINLDSMLRWDSAQRRASVSLDSPFAGDDSLRLEGSVDARDELWNLHGDLFALRRIDGTLSLRSEIRSRGMWATAITAGTGRLGYRASLDYDLARWPEQRLVVSTGIRTEVGRNLRDRFAKAEPSIRLHWLPAAHGSDFETSLQLRAGRASSKTPADELFVIGLDRDSDLLLRAHPSLSDGRLGASPTGNRYTLMNAETDKVLHYFGLARLTAGPFLDIARMSTTFVDSGIVFHLSVGPFLNVAFSLGRDLRSGRTVGFFN